MSKKGGKMEGGQLGAPQFEAGSVDPDDLKDFEGETGKDFESQFSCVEAMQAKVAGTWCFDSQSSLRYNIAQFAMNYDKNVRGKLRISRVIFQDKEMVRAIAVDMVSCKRWKKQPMFVVMYNVTEKKEAGTPRFLRAVDDQQKFHSEAQRDMENRLFQFEVTLPEQDMLISMLEHNAAMLPKNYKKELAKKYPDIYTPSAIVPLGKPYVDEGSAKLPCALCGERGSAWCSRCKSTWYCSKDCQKLDWKEHKKVCKEPSSSSFLDFDMDKVRSP